MVKGQGSRGRNEDGRHLMRYLKRKAGQTPEEIAAAEKVTPRAVYESIRKIEIHETKNSEGQLQLAVRDLIISSVPQAKETLHGLLTATETIEVKDHKTGKMENVKMEDKTTRLEALRIVKSLVETTQPKGPAVAVQVNQTNQTAQIAAKGGETFEERMRRLRSSAKEHNLLPAEVSAVPKSIDEGDEDDFAGDDDGDEEDGDDE